jgi:hypothetical protein
MKRRRLPSFGASSASTFLDHADLEAAKTRGIDIAAVLGPTS